MTIDPSTYPPYAAECGDPSRTKVLGFGSRPAILLVDVCEAYTNPRSPLALLSQSTDPAISAIARLLAAVRSTTRKNDGGDTIPIFYTQTVYTHAKLRDAGLAAQKQPHLDVFSATHPDHFWSIPSGETFPQLRPQPIDMVHRKKFPSAFFGTNLATQLAALGVDTVIIGGFLTSVAVRSTALDAMQSGFRPIVVMEACGDRGHETHWASLMDHNAKYGDVVGLEDALTNIQKGWA